MAPNDHTPISGKHFNGCYTGYTPRDTLAPYSWHRSVSWCLAEGYRKRRSAPPPGPMWLGKDFIFLLLLLHWLFATLYVLLVHLVTTK